MFAGRALFGIRAKAGFKQSPFTAHTYGLIPLAELTNVVGVPGSGVGDGGGDGDGDGDGDVDDDFSVQPTKIAAVAIKSPQDKLENL